MLILLTWKWHEMAGACPNSICGMQAIMFTEVKTGVDFWWTKPEAESLSKLNRNTLDLHNSGPHRNASSKSRALYQPLADKFKGSCEDSFDFGVDENGRAFIEEKSQSGRRRMLLYFVWQDWKRSYSFH